MSFRLGANILQSLVNTRCKFCTLPTYGVGMAPARFDCIQNQRFMPHFKRSVLWTGAWPEA